MTGLQSKNRFGYQVTYQEGTVINCNTPLSPKKMVSIKWVNGTMTNG